MTNTLPPSDPSAEQALLGAAMINPGVIDATGDRLRPSDFYSKTNATVWKAITRLHEEGKDVDFIQVKSFLGGKVDGGYVDSLLDACPVAANAKEYARSVREHAVRRQIIEAGHRITMLGHEDGSAESLIDRAETLAYELDSSRMQEDEPIGTVALTVLDDAESGKSKIALATGLPSIDEKAGGLHEQNFVVIGARPGIGKTALALGIALHVAQTEKVLFFSLEMSKRELVERALCILGRVDLRHIRECRITERDRPMLSAAYDKIIGLDLVVYDRLSCTPGEMRSRIRREKPKLVFVDYLQLMTLGGRAESRFLEVSTISRKMKEMAKEYNCTVVALSQLNRDSEGPLSDGKPKLSQLRESGAIEQDADQVWLMSWPKDKHGIVTVNVAKNRHGSIGEVELDWWPHQTRFSDRHG